MTKISKTPYEIHITVKVDENDENFNQNFKKNCDSIGVKPIVIEFESKGITNKDVMTSSKHFGNDESVYIFSRDIILSLREMGYNVIREKIETIPWHPDAPFESKGLLPNGRYFESHIGVSITPNMKSELNSFVNHLNLGKFKKFGGISKLSQNFFKKVKNGEYINMLTYRNYSCGYSEFKKDVDMIKFLLESNGFSFEKVEVEYALYDSNIEHDNNWLLN